MTGDELLVEAAVTAHRDRDADGRIRPSPAWMDLTAAQRVELFERQVAARRIEQAIDADGLSSTARTVLERAARLGQMERET